jgi:hypothetical protein
MRRRAFLGVLGAAVALSTAARAQGVRLQQIEPENELERVFIAAFTDPTQRPVFRRVLLESRVAVALANDEYDSPPRLLQIDAEREAGFVFTSDDRLSNVLGPGVPRRTMSGRQAFEFLDGKHVILNWRLAPMLTLEPEDVATYLARDDAAPAL